MKALIQHPEYAARSPQWRKIRDALAGEDAIKARGVEYLPMLGSQKEEGDQAQYESYKCRASWFGASKRTQQGLVGACTRKPIGLAGVPDADVKQLRDQVGQAYEPLEQVVGEMLRDLVTVGRHGLLVDAERDPEAAPYIANIPAEQIVHWQQSVLRGRVTLTMVALAEDYDREQTDAERMADPFGTQIEKLPQLRVLRLGTPPPEMVAASEGQFAGVGVEPVYWQEIWRQPVSEKGTTKASTAEAGLVLVEVIVPRKSGGRLWREIPFDVVNAVGGITPKTEDPAMLDLVNVQVAHYRGSADLEWGRHMCGIPQPWAAGFRLEEGQSLVVGARGAWTTDEPQAKVAYLEFSGAGLGHLAEGQKEKETQMAVLGSRMLEERANGVEAMGTVELRQAGETSVLSAIAANASFATSRAVQRWLSWQSAAFESDAAQAAVVATVEASVNAKSLDAATMTALTAQLQAGTISWETYAYQLQQGEMLPDGVTPEEEAKRIQRGGPGRSRTAELQLLQNDVLAGRISNETYLLRAQELGFYQGLDVAAEIAAAEEQKARAVENQMLALAARSGFGGGPSFGGGDPPAGDPEEREGPDDEGGEADPEEPEGDAPPDDEAE